jgi:predicted MPP superfamily phosphohydrolase
LLSIDIYGWLIKGAEFISHRDFSSLLPAKKTVLLISLIWAAAAGIYGYYEASNIKTERIVIKTAKIPKEIEKLTIVQISDVHLGLIIRSERLQHIAAAIKKASPDILVSTGDLVDGQINSMEGLAELLQDIRPVLGKFAVTGNHEIYAGLRQAVELTERAGFRMLNDEAATAGNLINIVGVQDPAIKRVKHFQPAQETNILRKVPSDKFTLLLKHRPYVDTESIGLFDLQLSGHVHKGQIFPFNLITYLFFPVKAGFTQYPQNSAFYVSRGTGTWGPPIRFLAPPEVTVIELMRAR